MPSNSDKTDTDMVSWFSSDNARLRQHLRKLEGALPKLNANYRSLILRGTDLTRPGKLCLPTRAMLAAYRSGTLPRYRFDDPSPVVQPSAELREHLVALPAKAFGGVARKGVHMRDPYTPAELAEHAALVLTEEEKEQVAFLPELVNATDEALLVDLLATVKNQQARDSWEARAAGSGRFLLRLWVHKASLVSNDAGSTIQQEFDDLVADGVSACTLDAFNDYADTLAELATGLINPLSERQHANHVLTGVRNLGERVADKVESEMRHTDAEGDLELTKAACEFVLSNLEQQKLKADRSAGRAMRAASALRAPGTPAPHDPRKSGGNATRDRSGTAAVMSEAEATEWLKLHRACRHCGALHFDNKCPYSSEDAARRLSKRGGAKKAATRRRKAAAKLAQSAPDPAPAPAPALEAPAAAGGANLAASSPGEVNLGLFGDGSVTLDLVGGALVAQGRSEALPPGLNAVPPAPLVLASEDEASSATSELSAERAPLSDSESEWSSDHSAGESGDEAGMVSLAPLLRRRAIAAAAAADAADAAAAERAAAKRHLRSRPRPPVPESQWPPRWALLAGGCCLCVNLALLVAVLALAALYLTRDPGMRRFCRRPIALLFCVFVRPASASVVAALPPPVHTFTLFAPLAWGSLFLVACGILVACGWLWRRRPPPPPQAKRPAGPQAGAPVNRSPLSERGSHGHHHHHRGCAAVQQQRRACHPPSAHPRVFSADASALKTRHFERLSPHAHAASANRDSALDCLAGAAPCWMLCWFLVQWLVCACLREGYSRSRLTWRERLAAADAFDRRGGGMLTANFSARQLNRRLRGLQQHALDAAAAPPRAAWQALHPLRSSLRVARMLMRTLQYVWYALAVTLSLHRANPALARLMLATGCRLVRCTARAHCLRLCVACMRFRSRAIPSGVTARFTVWSTST